MERRGINVFDAVSGSLAVTRGLDNVVESSKLMTSLPVAARRYLKQDPGHSQGGSYKTTACLNNVL